MNEREKRKVESWEKITGGLQKSPVKSPEYPKPTSVSVPELGEVKTTLSREEENRVLDDEIELQGKRNDLKTLQEGKEPLSRRAKYSMILGITSLLTILATIKSCGQ